MISPLVLALVAGALGVAGVGSTWLALHPAAGRNRRPLQSSPGDARAIGIRDGVFFGAASAVRLLALAYGTDTVVIGGGLTGLGRALCDGMARHFAEWSATSPLIASLQLDAITHVLTDERPTHAIGAAIVGGQHG